MFPRPLPRPCIPLSTPDEKRTGLISCMSFCFAGVKSYDVSLDKQEALVVAEPGLDYETVLRTIKKTGKKVNTGEADGEAKSIELAD